MEINTKKLLVQNNKNFKRQQKMLRKMNDMKENLIYGGGQKYLKAVNNININNNNQLFQTIEQIYSTTCKNNYLKNINTTENDYSHEIDDNEANVEDADCYLDFDCDQEINRILNAKNNLLLLKQKNYLILNSYCFNNLSSASSSASSASTNTRHLISSAFHSSRKICTIANKNKRPFLDLEKMMMRV